MLIGSSRLSGRKSPRLGVCLENPKDVSSNQRDFNELRENAVSWGYAWELQVDSEGLGSFWFLLLLYTEQA
jgi:hypothetical protein